MTPQWGSMRTKLVELQAEYENLSQKFLPTYPKMQQLKAQIDNTLSSIENQRRQIVMGLKAKAQAAIETESLLKEELEKQKSQTFELSKSQVQYNILNRELDSSRELLGNVLKQIKETSLAVRSNSTNVAIVDSATLPKYPSYPNKKLALMMGLFLGLALGLGVALFIHFMDNTIKTPEELTNVVRIPSLGVIPSFEFNQEKEEQRTSKKKVGALGFYSDRRSNNELSADRQEQQDEFGQDSDGNSSGSFEPQLSEQDQNSLPIQLKDSFLPIIYVESPQSLASEAYRTIRTGILLSKAGEPPRTILVSSAQSSEGKTTSAVNLAVTLASSGGQVVIVDADLRRPSVYKYFALERNLPGLVELLTGQAQFEDLAITGLVKRLTVVPSGRIPPNPAELLGSLEMARLIDELSRRYDYVIIDSPPVLPVTDSVILSRYVDGVVMVVRGASTPRKVVLDATNRLRAVGANLLGAILNDVDVTNGDYYYYNRYYSLYYQEDNQKERTTKAAG
jgi:succinoglycan biosynthesis transport protein ExoP